MHVSCSRFRVHRQLTRIILGVSLLLSGSCAARPPLETRPTAAGIIPLQQEIVSRLAGATDIRPGVKLDNRFSVENKREARAYLAALLKRFGFEVKRQAYGTTGGENMYVVLPCGRPGAEAIVLGAHYDSVQRARRERRRNGCCGGRGGCSGNATRGRAHARFVFRVL